ncbi:DUF2793 domain-containing protein [Pseudooceanicola nanhaiensis]|uniref:DUF2793 domain-containing protein n=1 Tax=Pseudooceanicola nanhaiensis TaxID=375761 RepID=UPI001CD4E220|nr:DUF2793 domain-containing protein [Pseudooceanicola nanhaiensis]MCA0922768.1 DUF2793 domain-containing protein [Pseudooceanicola nanhaiensis]
MSDSSPRLALPYLQPAQAQKHVTVNTALAGLDLLVQSSVAAIGSVTPPAVPGEGEAHVLGSGATGAWAGQDGALALWADGAWSFRAPQPGWRVWDLAEGALRIWDGTGWVHPPVDLSEIEAIGIGTAASTANPLSVAGPASLFTHAGGGHQLKINKAATGETATLLLQSDWTGHAEIGLAGTNALALKVSADGSAWTTALSFDPATGLASGACVQQAPEDGSAGQLMPVGAFGLGATAVALDSSADMADNLNATHFFANPSVNSVPANAPPVADMAWAGYQVRITSSRSIRLVGSASGDHLFWQGKTSGTWEDWDRLFTQRSVLGSVTQSAGRPTGALIESGSGANGRYRRFACGFMECWHSMTASAAAATGWTFPAAFAEPPVVTGTAVATVLAAVVLDAAPTTTAASLSVRDAADARRADGMYLRATGCWSLMS